MSLKMASAILLAFVLSSAISYQIPIFKPYYMSLAGAVALSTALIAMAWGFRKYISFSLGALLLALLTLQIPFALMINPWKVDWLPGLGGVLLLIWLCGVYIYALDRGLNRWVRERSLARLKAEETKGIGKL